MINLGEADRIDQMISMWRVSITHEAESRHVSRTKQPGQTRSPGMSAGIDLRAAVFDPLLAAIKECKRLIIAPDGDLTRLSFEVLPTGDERYLIDEYQISYLSTGRDLLRIGSTTSDQSTPPVVVADPDFDLELDSTASTTARKGDDKRQVSRVLRQSGLYFNRLPGTRLEGTRIARMLGIHPLSGKSALESSLKERHSPRIVHLATHGFFLKYLKPVLLTPEDFSVGMVIKPADPQHRIMVLDGIMATSTEFVDASHEDEFSRLSGQGLENPMLRSGLALAGANTWLNGGLLPPEAEDGILTAEDVSGMDLWATELVVLSACETGLGEVQVGEGVFGLRRAFILAGAKTLVMSLWKAPDQQTQQLMIDFYERILSGQSHSAALRAAQLAIKAKDRDPFYWGAFICQGDPG
jgi:CHAT domain-containing protein